MVDKFWYEHAYLLYIFIIGCFVIIGYFFTVIGLMMRKIFSNIESSMATVCDNIKDLYERQRQTEEKVNELHGEHIARISSKKC